MVDVLGKRMTALLVAALALGAPAAAFEVEPVRYWVPGGPFGFGGGAAEGRADRYSNVPGFDAGAASDWKDNFRTGLFVRSEAGGQGWSGFAQPGAFGGGGTLSYQSALAGYNFKGVGGLPVSFYAGFDTLKFNPGFGGPLTPFSSDGSIPAGTVARAGIALQPAPNISLSFEAGFAQSQSSRLDSDINSPLLPGQSSAFIGGMR